jgi:hypothetical protein
VSGRAAAIRPPAERERGVMVKKILCGFGVHVVAERLVRSSYRRPNLPPLPMTGLHRPK